MQITHKFSIDLVRRGMENYVEAVQCDANTRAVEVTLLEDEAAWNPPAGVSVSVAYCKSDGTKGWYDKLPNGTAACSVTGNVVTAILAPQVLTAAGPTAAAIVFQNSNTLDQLATFPFLIKVEKNPAAGQTVSNDYYNYSTMAEVNEAVDAYIAEIQQTMDSYLAKAETTLETIQEVVTGDAADAPAVICKAEGEVIAVSDASNRLLQNLRIFGKTTQDGTPTPDNPVELVSVGNSGSIALTVAGKNLLDVSNTDGVREGVTWTVSDGVITANGVATSASVITVYLSNSGYKADNYYVQGASANIVVRLGLKTNGVYSFCNSGNYVNLNDFDTYEAVIFQIYVEAGVTVVNEKCYPMLHVGTSEAGFEPYKGQSLTISTPNGLPGIKLGATIPKYIANSPAHMSGVYWDEETQAYWIGDTIDGASGKYVHRLKLLDYASNTSANIEPWTTSDVNKTRFVLASDALFVEDPETVSPMLCTIATAGSAIQSYLCGNYISGSENKVIFYMEDIASMTQTEALAWMREKAVKVQYILATPIETALPAEELAAYAALHTNYPNTTVYNDAGVVQQLEYVADTKTYIDNKFAALSAAIVNN